MKTTVGVKVRRPAGVLNGKAVDVFESVKVGVKTDVNVWATRGDAPKHIKPIKYKNRVLFIISHFNLVAV